MRAATQRRRDLHNVSIDFAVAAAGLCGFTHLPSRRVCRLPLRHSGPCDLRFRPADTRNARTDRDRVGPAGRSM
jgi:hypothetical protein